MLIGPLPRLRRTTRWPSPPRYFPAPPESGISSLHSVRTGTAISNISIAVTLQFEGKLRVSRPSISERAPCPPWKFCTEPYCEPSSRWPTQLAAHIGAPPLSPITLSGTTFPSALKISEGMTWPIRLRELPAVHWFGLRIEPSGASSVIGVIQPSLFGVSGSSRHFRAYTEWA